MPPRLVEAGGASGAPAPDSRAPRPAGIDPATPSAAARASHDRVYGSGQVAAFAHWPVTARIRAGRNPLTELDVLELARLGTTHLLDLREPHEWSPPRFGEEAIAALARHGIERRSIPLPDLEPPPPAALTAAVAWLDATLAPGIAGGDARLYVHCRAGRERTATVLLAWQLQHHGGPPRAALEHLRRHGWPARPLPSQLRAIAAWLERGLDCGPDPGLDTDLNAGLATRRSTRTSS